jgi:hypothetical protein
MTPADLQARGWTWDAALCWYSHTRYGSEKFTFREACEKEKTA